MVNNRSFKNMNKLYEKTATHAHNYNYVNFDYINNNYI